MLMYARLEFKRYKWPSIRCFVLKFLRVNFQDHLESSCWGSGKWKYFDKHENKISLRNKLTSGTRNANVIFEKDVGLFLLLSPWHKLDSTESICHNSGAILINKPHLLVRKVHFSLIFDFSFIKYLRGKTNM